MAGRTGRARAFVTIKGKVSRLLGTAAACAISGSALAADAIVAAEPEPMDYVRVCDAFGAGFFYIPGTETCLKIGGYVRFDIGVGNMPDYGFGADAPDDIDTDGDGIADTGDGRGDARYEQARFALDVDARTDSEYGTLRGTAKLHFNYDQDATSSSHYIEVEYAYIELGGFRVGMNDSLFSTFPAYAGYVISDDLGVPYGPFETSQIVYTHTGENGFSAAGGLELPGDGATNSDYVPNIVAGASLTKDWGAIAFIAAYDAVAEEGAAKLRLDLTLSDKVSVFAMAGYSTNDPAGTGVGNTDSNNYYAQWNGDWALWAGANFQVTDKLAFYTQAAYDEDENFAFVADLPVTVVDGFTVTPELAYRDNFDIPDADAWGGYLRFERTF
ncbi:porin [Shinella sp. M27]|uniref:porin n=1 Tax=Shinella sp. M27 TaxID=3368614 RepID=UPI003BA0D8C0